MKVSELNYAFTDPQNGSNRDVVPEER